ncbi:hypothetical protein GCK72_020834 [Caenorhabditis remanei]|uniref:Uncharacterized protein n=1 Tax=Caenorhabditis remanei TaxID=31234 RepID=A0A6A5GHM0_CAERE|nr:hypothetical protein GCK72_020834 [Caenorhabditis remanei]KAF1754274.1 hypothetical protein GCK72_020834 [Caenorhabditis remanei]
MAEKIEKYHYIEMALFLQETDRFSILISEIPTKKIPPFIRPDAKADPEKVDKDWLKKFLSKGNENKDEDVEAELMKTLFAWEVKCYDLFLANPQGRRTHEYYLNRRNIN